MRTELLRRKNQHKRLKNIELDIQFLMSKNRISKWKQEKHF